MPASRRKVILQGFAIGAGLIASQTPGIVALAQGAPPLRRSLHGMATNDPILEAWRDGVSQLKAKPATDPMSWASFAAIHGTAAGFNKCPHGNWYFLPWHRGYLLMYERAVRQLTGFADFALPYWDWTEDRQMPPAFVTPADASNPLFEPRDASPTDALDDPIVGPGVIATILSEAPFETFGTTRAQQPRPQDDLDPSWISNRSGFQGTLEGTPHNLVHGFVGGIMGGFRSAGDPIFMMHHCNIDRIWWTWRQAGQVDTPDSLWTDMVFQDHFLNPDGTPFSPKVADLLVPEPLGYTYNSSPTPTPTPPVVVDGYETIKSLYTVADLTSTKLAGVTAYVAANAEAAVVAKYLEVSVPVAPEVLNKVAHARAMPSGLETLDLSLARKLAASAPRAFAFLRDIAATDVENTEYRVFINCDYLSADTPTTDRSYVGSFGFFGSHAGHGDGPHQQLPSVALDLTSAIQGVFGSAADPPKSLRIQIQPVALRRKSTEPVGAATPARVEVAIVNV